MVVCLAVGIQGCGGETPRSAESRVVGEACTRLATILSDQADVLLMWRSVPVDGASAEFRTLWLEALLEFEGINQRRPGESSEVRDARLRLAALRIERVFEHAARLGIEGVRPDKAVIAGRTLERSSSYASGK